MEEWVTTTGIAFALFALAVALAAVCWMWTGKSKLIRSCNEKISKKEEHR